MAQQFPYTYYACCVNISSSSSIAQKRSSRVATAHEEDEDRTFDPRSPRANYSLYPLEHLLYCDDCQQIRCPRCYTEEIVAWYCPSCLFDVPNTQVRTEGNRCQRNCYNCPICTSPLQVNPLEHSSHLAPEGSSGASYFLGCPYCNWSSLDIGVEFAKHTGITAQLAKLKSARQSQAKKERHERAENKDIKDTDPPNAPPTHDDLFTNLRSFYKDTLSSTNPVNPLSFDPTLYNSPPSVTRLMNLYAPPSAKRAKAAKPTPMREAHSPSEGFLPLSPTTEDATIARMAQAGWDGLTSTAQRVQQQHPTTKFVDDLWPVQTRLLTRRAKRCATCRHILTKPDSKISSTRYRIRILALDKIPRLSIRALAAHNTPHPSFPITVSSTASSSTTASRFEYESLRPGVMTQYLLTLHNPLFEPIRVTLGTPAVTPGNLASRVTVLCPQFEVGANTDVWDEALNSSAALSSKSKTQPGDAPIQAEAGKVWERGRNWTSVVVEIVPGFPGDTVVEVPVFVRLEYEYEHPDAAVFEKMREEGGAKVLEVPELGKQTREVAFWTVLGVGKVAGG
ncbi:hypothetical protein H2199_007636 [Coniosporium tulheliwenetii]|uniref:Uncharacterized protein n=1 Tax=Coniosporium tulheliwenetii TaxID=3383036 RepID=A0ACC2YPU3_9PEZI|nr:hypothetical protein H2199_007636 [Cladosporium sp. JES 115]